MSNRLNIDDARLNVGRRVLYHPGHGPLEPGVITGVAPGWNGFVFVLYDGDRHSKATLPDDLSLEFG